MIEEKIARLPPELRQEVEDFVDYLLKRYGDYRDEHRESSLTPVILAQESGISGSAEDSPLTDRLLDLDVMEAAGGRNRDEGSESRDCRNILEWID